MNINMKTIWKIIIIAIAVGLVLAVIGFTLGAGRSLYFDRTGVRVSGNEVTHITEHDLASFRNINIDAGFSDVEFVSSNAYGIEINSDYAELDWTLENDTLTISLVRSSRVQIINFNFSLRDRNYIRVFIPNDASFDTVTVKASSGDVRIGDIRATSVEVNITSGNIRLNDISSDYLQVGSTSGNITSSAIDTKDFIHNIRSGNGRLQTINAERFSAELTSGDLSITEGELGAVCITGQSGNITVNDITSQSTNVQLTSGDIRLSGDFSGETVAQARSGNVSVSTSGERNDYSFDLSVTSGTVRLDGERLRGGITSNPTLENHINITTTSGNITVSFTG